MAYLDSLARTWTAHPSPHDACRLPVTFTAGGALAPAPSTPLSDHLAAPRSAPQVARFRGFTKADLSNCQEDADALLTAWDTRMARRAGARPPSLLPSVT